MEDAIVLYPSPGIGHLISMVELGKLILNHHRSFSINILITTPPYNTGRTAPYIDRVSAANPSIHFHHLPSVPLSVSTTSLNHETLAFQLLLLNNPHVHQALTSISQTSTPCAFIIDFFCASALSVAKDLNIPTYFFYTSGAGALASFLYLPTIHRSTAGNLKDLKTSLHIPGLPPFRASDMMKPVLDRSDKAYEFFLDVSLNFPKASGIITNTFEYLEPRSIKAISSGLCVSNSDGPPPPIYCIGPLIAAGDRSDGKTLNRHECLRWLDSQPSKSVVFLCFGSLGLFPMDQLREIAIGLERSGCRFLWVVRSPPPPPENQTERFLAPADPDLGALLPDGFMDRTEGRGFVVKSWAPQVEVLSHDSVGGFVTHCGWNSVLEAVCAGVPMVAWPLYAEQRFNRVVLVEEMKLALPMEESEDGFICASEVEKRVTELMDSVDGRLVRKHVLAARDAAKAAIGDGGSSRLDLGQLIELWTQN